eukprot:scaffold166355_cov18-Tisochrysis_lutea.AAC.2
MGCSSCGQPCMQTLKNLVLGGIASFTVVDDARCSAIDLGNNFMVGPSSLGEPRAKPCTTFCSTAECKGWAAKVRGIVVQGCMALRQACAFVRFMEPALTLVGCAGELNESVAGSYIEESPENLINSNPQFFHQFTVVVATQHENTLLVVLTTQKLVKQRRGKPEICRIGTKPCWLLSGGALFIVLLIVGSAVELLKDGKCSGAAYRWGTQLSCPRVGNTVELLIDGRWSWGGTKGGEGMRLPEAFRIFV